MKLRYEINRLPEIVEVVEIENSPGVPLGVKLYFLKSELLAFAKDQLKNVPVGSRIQANFLSMTKDEFLELPNNLQIEQVQEEQNYNNDIAEDGDPSI